jgi:hypothetical protein
LCHSLRARAGSQAEHDRFAAIRSADLQSIGSPLVVKPHGTEIGMPYVKGRCVEGTKPSRIEYHNRMISARWAPESVVGVTSTSIVSKTAR